MTDHPAATHEFDGNGSVRPQSRAAASNKPSSSRSAGRTVMGLSAIALGAKAFGFAEKVVIAHYLGTSPTADVYFAVMGIFFSAIFLVKELIYPSLLPVFTRTLTGSHEEADCLFKRTFWMVAMALAALGGILIVGASSLGRLLTPGFSETQRSTAAFLLRFLTPGLMGLGLIAVTATTLNARGRFWVAAVGEAGVKFCIVAGFMLLMPSGKMGVIPLTIALAAVSGLGFHLYCLDERKGLLRPYSSDWSAVKDMLLLMGPLVVGVLFSHWGDLVDNFLASRLPAGQLACLNYAKKMTDALLLIGPVCLVTVVYPRLSQLASRRSDQECRRLLRKAFRLILFVCLPVACLIFSLRVPLVRCLFEHGRFDGHSTAGTADALMIYAAGFVTFSLESLLVYGFFALSDTKTPVTLGVLSVIANIPLAAMLSGRWGHLGLAAALVIVKSVKVGVLAYWLGKRCNGLWAAHDAGYLLKLVGMVMALAATVRIIGTTAGPESWTHALARNVLAPAGTGLAVFGVLSFVLRMEEAKWVFHWVHGKRNLGTQA